MHSRLFIHFLLTLLAISQGASLVSAQSQATLPTIDAVEIEFSGVKNVSEQAVLAHVQIQGGMVFNQNLVDRSIRSLYDTQLFDFISVKIAELPNNRINLIFEVQPKYRIDEIIFKGNASIATSKLHNQITSKINEVLDERQLKTDTEKILDYYKKKGYSRIYVDYTLERNAASGYGKVIFKINEGAKLYINDIRFIGNHSISSRKLRKQMETNDRSMWSWMTGSGRFNEATFQEDIDKLRGFYKDRGFLDIDISESNIRLNYPTTKKINITIMLTEGRRYKVGTIDFDGNTLFSNEVLSDTLDLRPGEYFSPGKLDEDTSALRDHFGQIGYLETSVRAERIPNLETGDIDILYKIREGKKVQVESIQIAGNTKTKSIVILRELALAPGDVFDLVKMKSSERRLKNTRYFETVNLSPESTNIPGRRNLKVAIQEGRTGNLTFGAGFSSLENGVIFIEVSQGNFDLFNPGSMFQGDGQKFRLRLQLGSSSNEVILAFEEPWLFEQRLAAGFELFRTETDFVSADFDELRTGLELYLRKRLRGLWEGRLAYRYEIVDIQDVDPTSAQFIKDEQGSTAVSKVTLSILHDTRDNLIFTTRGSRINLISEIAGLGGDAEYLKLEARGSQFIPTLEWGDQVLSILARAGTIINTGNKDVPFFDRYFLGGPNTLRGFDFRDVGPKAPDQPDEPLGGNTFGFFSLEYTFKIAEPLRFAVFYDWGFINSGDSDFDPSNYNDNWGIGLRLLIMGAPLRLDFGLPITTDDSTNNDDGTQFYFSFGTRF